MKRIMLALSLSFILCVSISFISFKETSENLKNKIIRLHIPANSDTEEDQEIKLIIKDEIFLYVNNLLKNSTSFDESKEILESNLSVIENKANKILKEKGKVYLAKANMEKSYFKTREYENFTLPAGEYLSLKITLGEGEGQNWWCAVYPSLCIPESSDFKKLTNEENKLIESEFKISFLLYEWYLELVRFLTP